MASDSTGSVGRSPFKKIATSLFVQISPSAQAQTKNQRDVVTMAVQVNSSLENISSGAKWRGHLEGLRGEKTLVGWALLAADPQSPLKLDLYIHGVHFASTHTNINRSEIDRVLGLKNPATCGFKFDLKTFRPEAALELLRKFGQKIPKANVKDDLRVCIAGTQHPLPAARANAKSFLDLTSLLPDLIRAAAAHLRLCISLGADTSQTDLEDQQILLMVNPLFSEDWYGETYGEIGLTGITPAEHYARLYSVLERPPGPWFDTASYLDALPKGQVMRLPPVIHYDVHGHDSWWPGQDLFRSTASDGLKNDKDYAVIIYFDQLDMAPAMERFIANFPENADIFITIPDTINRDSGAVARLSKRARDVQVVPSERHNVAAFLETVRRVKSRGYRFFCTANFSESNNYPDVCRRVMFDALASTPARVAEVVSLFRSDPRTLLAGPKQFWLNGADFEHKHGHRLKEFMGRMQLGAGALLRDWAFFADACFWIDAELAGHIAETITADDFTDFAPTSDCPTAHAVERMLGLFATAMGGHVALLDGCDWLAAPAIARDETAAGLRVAAGETASDFFNRYFRSLDTPQTVEGSALKPSKAGQNDLPDGAGSALHGTIDVMVSCWNGTPEKLHHGIVDLGKQLDKQGLTWSVLVTKPVVRDIFHAASCWNVSLESLHLQFPPTYTRPTDHKTEAVIADKTAMSLLRSGSVFAKKALPEGEALETALNDIRRLYSCWHEILTRHKVKVFLIWGNTAPKSRLFIQLCQDMAIEYQIIERGHFPGTLSIDPKGQFGTGVITQLMTHLSSAATPSEHVEARYAAIRTWYDAQHDNAAYEQFQKRGTRDLDIMRRARCHGRPVILVIGGNDQGAGVVGPQSDHLNVNWFGTSDNAFTVIKRLVATKFPEALLVLRPHPSQLAQFGDFVLVARETSLDDLIDEADLCITIATTASAICLLKDKPLLALGLSELNGQDVVTSITDETHLLAMLRQHIWSGFASPYPDRANRTFTCDLFDRHLIGISNSVPTQYHIGDLARLLAGRIQRLKSGFQEMCGGKEELISQMMFEDVRDRGRAILRVDRGVFDRSARPPISVVLPIYGDYDGTRVCFDQLVRHQKENNYRIIVVWDRGPDVRLRELCIEYAEKAGFTYLENRENLGFSGTVNIGILKAGRDDVILLNSDTIPCGDWALRLQDAAYTHPRIASVVPFSNNASIYNVPFPNGEELPAENPVEWAEALDTKARETAPCVVEMPVSHGYCSYFRRSTFDKSGLFNESKFDKGYGEDNEFSMRIRAAGYFCGCATNVFVAHAGSTSFAENAVELKVAGRGTMHKEFSHYSTEIRHFVENDPLTGFRKNLLAN